MVYTWLIRVQRSLLVVDNFIFSLAFFFSSTWLIRVLEISSLNSVPVLFQATNVVACYSMLLYLVVEVEKSTRIREKQSHLPILVNAWTLCRARGQISRIPRNTSTNRVEQSNSAVGRTTAAAAVSTAVEHSSRTWRNIFLSPFAIRIPKPSNSARAGWSVWMSCGCTSFGTAKSHRGSRAQASPSPCDNVTSRKVSS